MSQSLPCEAVPTHPDFRRLDSIAGAKVDLRYASPHNFVGRDLYSPLDCAWLHRRAAAALETSIAWLRERRPDLGVLILDALRPQRVQEQLWAALAGTDLQMYLAEPSRGSIHSFGMALDITLIDANDVELDMGTPFDDLTELSHPAKEARFLASGAIDAAQIAHRELLRGMMMAGGFQGINTEWWHFDCGDRLAVRRDFARVL
ncbi:MAG: M15 family metallopeptidase [Betaproteobacteria bacterium]|nr:M15 family metallopeptidase [Betaproteobacteria bacterium]